MQNTSLSNLTAAQLRRALDIRERIDALEKEMNSLLGAIEPPQSTGVAHGPKKVMSASAKAKIAAAAKARWAPIREQKSPTSPTVATKPKPTVSAAVRARIAAAARERWA